MDPPARLSRRVLLILFGLALGLRLLATFELAAVDPYFDVPLVDEQTNHQLACRVADGDVRPETPFWKPPFYPYVLGMLYALGFESALAVKVLQALLDSGTTLLLALWAARVTGRATAAIIAGGLYAVAFTPVYFANQLLDTTLFTFFCVLTLTALSAGRRDAAGWLLAGGLLGLATITRAPALLFLPAAIAWAWWREQEKALGPRFVAVALLGCGTFLPVLPVALMNWRFAGDAVLISSNGGYNFYVGNRQGDDIGSDGLTPMRVGPRDREVMALADQSLPPSERSRALYREARKEILAAPGAWLRRLGRKTHALLDGYEIPNNKNFDEEGARSWVYTLLPGRTGIIWALGLVGLGFLWGRLRDRGLLVGFLVTQAAGIIGFFVAARYRVPLTAVLCVPAGALLAAVLADDLPRRRWALGAALLLLLGLNGDLLGRRARYQDYVIDPLALGHAHELRAAKVPPGSAEHRAELAQAQWFYELSLRLDPDYPEAENNLGILALARGEPEAAEGHFRRAVEIPDDAQTSIPGFTFAEGWNNLGRLLAEDPSRREESETCFERAIRDEPGYANPHANLGQLYLMTGRPRRSRESFGRALELAPDHTLYALQYIRASLVVGDRPTAERWLEKVRARRADLGPAEAQLLAEIERNL